MAVALALCALSSTLAVLPAPRAEAAPAAGRAAALRQAGTVQCAGNSEAWWDASWNSCVKLAVGAGEFYTENSARDPLPLPGEQPFELFYNANVYKSTRGYYWPLGPTAKPASRAPTPWQHTNYFSAGPAYSCWDVFMCASRHNAPPGWPRGATWRSHQEHWVFLRLVLVACTECTPVTTTTATTPTTVAPKWVDPSWVELRPTGVTVAPPGTEVVPVGGALRPLTLSASFSATCRLTIYRNGVPSAPVDDTCSKLKANSEVTALFASAGLNPSAYMDQAVNTSAVTGEMTLAADPGITECAGTSTDCHFKVVDVASSAPGRVRKKVMAFRASPSGSFVWATSTANWTGATWSRVQIPGHYANTQATVTMGPPQPATDLTSGPVKTKLRLVGAVQAGG